MNLELITKDGVTRSLGIHIPDTESPEEEANHIFVKVKFYKDSNDTENNRIRVRFNRKRGDVLKWSDLFKKIKQEQLSDVLLLPREHMEQ
jgi:hypothetical protein